MVMMRLGQFGRGLAMLVMTAAGVCPVARAMEHVTLRNGFEVDCVRREVAGDKVRLYFAGSGVGASGNFLEVAADEVVRVELVADLAIAKTATVKTSVSAVPVTADVTEPTAAELREMIGHAGVAHNIDADLLASVVRAESGGQVRAVSRTGARGLMQLMPATASELGVQDSFKADQNIAGGTAYLDGLLVRYHDNVALALAAYNAGPAAVDRYRGVPPYAETRAYVARVIREFNRRKRGAMVVAAR
jgi:soluble lytic murein transglycosylase-like protein